MAKSRKGLVVLLLLIVAAWVLIFIGVRLPETGALSILGRFLKKDAINNFVDYRCFLDKLNSKELESVSSALHAYSQNKDKFSQADKDHSFVAYYNFCQNVWKEFSDYDQEELDAMLFKEISDGSDAEADDGYLDSEKALTYLNEVTIIKKNSKVQELTERIYSSGLRYSMSEGSFSFEEQPGFLLDYFGDDVSAAYRDFLLLEEQEKQRSYSDDAGLAISFAQLGERLIAWEDFLRQHPGFEFEKEILDKCKIYRIIFLSGLENSPIFDYSTGRIDSEAQQAYKDFAVKYGTRESGQLVREFYELLEKENFRYTEAIGNFYLKNNLYLSSDF